MSDLIRLDGMEFYAFHGVSSREKRIGRTFTVDLEIATDLSLPGLTDKLSDTINYSDIYLCVREVMEGSKRNLLESLAAEIAKVVIDRFPVNSARVSVRKRGTSITGASLEAAAVEIFRDRKIEGNSLSAL